MNQGERVSFIGQIAQTLQSMLTEESLFIGIGLSLFLVILGMNTVCGVMSKTGKPKNVKMDDLIDNQQK